MNTLLISLFGVSVLGILVDIVATDNNRYLGFVFDLVVLLVVVSGVVRLLSDIGLI